MITHSESSGSVEAQLDGDGESETIGRDQLDDATHLQHIGIFGGLFNDCFIRMIYPKGNIIGYRI